MTIRHDNGPAVSPLSDSRRAAVRSELLRAIGNSPDPRSSRARAALVTAALATVVAAALVAGPSLLAGNEPASSPIVLAAAEGRIPLSTAPCSGPQVADASQLRGATYLINDSPIALSEVWASIDECPVALPLATFVEATGNEDDSVLTLWGPDAKAGVASVEAFEGAYTTVLPGSRTDAWVVEFPWGAWVQWSDDTGDYILTASGIEADTATAAAAAYSETRSQESIHAILPDLQLVPAAELPARNTRWTAVYGNSDPRPGDDTPWLSLEVTAGELPATALASLQPIPATGLTLREPTTSDVHTGDNGGFRYARWTTATGAHVQLIGNLTIDELRGLAMQVQAVLPADPRIDGKQILSPPATVQTL